MSEKLHVESGSSADGDENREKFLTLLADGNSTIEKLEEKSEAGTVLLALEEWAERVKDVEVGNMPVKPDSWSYAGADYPGKRHSIETRDSYFHEMSVLAGYLKKNSPPELRSRFDEIEKELLTKVVQDIYQYHEEEAKGDPEYVAHLGGVRDVAESFGLDSGKALSVIEEMQASGTIKTKVDMGPLAPSWYGMSSYEINTSPEGAEAMMSIAEKYGLSITADKNMGNRGITRQRTEKLTVSGSDNKGDTAFWEEVRSTMSGEA